MRSIIGTSILVLLLSALLTGTVLADEQETETENQEEAVQPALEDNDADALLDTEEQSWSNVKALWG